VRLHGARSAPTPPYQPALSVAGRLPPLPPRGVLLTGLGALTAGQFTDSAGAQDLAAATVASALGAQVLSITRHLNPANLAAVQAWYRQFTLRAYATQAATILLIAAALLAGATAATTILTTTH
jgi:hypothetical protein